MVENNHINYKFMEKKTITVFKFAELSEKAKESVLKEFRGINVAYHAWYENIYREASAIGLRINGFQLSPLYIDSHFFVEGQGREVAENIIDKVDENSVIRSYAVKYLDAVMSPVDPDYTSNEFRSDLQHYYLDRLTSEYATLTDDADVLSTIEANGYLFMRDGRIWDANNA